MNKNLATVLFLSLVLCLAGCPGKKPETSTPEAPGNATTPALPLPAKEALDRLGPENSLNVRWLLSDPLLVVTGQPKKFFTSPIGKNNEGYFSEIVARFLMVPSDFSKIERFVQSFSLPMQVPVEVEENGEKVLRPALVSRRCTILRFDGPISPDEVLVPFAKQTNIKPESRKRKLGEVEYYDLTPPNQPIPQNVAFCFADDRTLVLLEGLESDIADAFDAKPPQGAAIDRIKRLNVDSSDLALAASREGIAIDPGDLQELLTVVGVPGNFSASLAKNFRALTVSCNMEAESGKPMLEVLYDAVDDKGAVEVGELLQGLLVMGQTTLAAMDESAKRSLPASPEFAADALSAMSVETTDVRVAFRIDKFGDFDKVAADAIRNQKESIRQMRILQSKNEQMLFLTQAFAAYYQMHKKFPATILSADGRPLLSWRVALLPTLGLQDLFNQFKKDEPWDSEANKPLLEKMPSVFQTIGEKIDPGKTLIRTFRSEGTPLFNPDLKAEDLKNAQSTLLFFSALPTQAVEWTRPDEPVWQVDQIESLTGNTFFGVTFAGQIVAMPILPLSDARSEQQRKFLDALVKGLAIPEPPQATPPIQVPAEKTEEKPLEPVVPDTSEPTAT